MPAVSKRPLTAEDLYRLELISEPRLSPNGKHVIYCQQRVDKKTEKKSSNLWLADTLSFEKLNHLLGTGSPRQFTYGDQVDSAPRWSPDGSQIAFLSNRGNRERGAQIHLIAVDGGEARPLTEIEGEITFSSWAPDGKRLLCLVRKYEPEELERFADPQKKALGVVARQVTRLFYKLDGYGYLPRERTHIWLVDARAGKGRQLTESDVWDELDPAFSPDGTQIAFISNHSEAPDEAPDCQDLFVLSVPALTPGGERTTTPASSAPSLPLATRKIPAPAGPKRLPAFSPDGRWIAYLGSDGVGAEYKNFHLWIVPANGAQEARNLTAQEDFHCAVSILADCGSPEQMAPVWSPDGKQIYFQVSWHGSVVLKRISVEDGKISEVVGEGGVVGAFSFDKSHSRVAYFFGQMHNPGQIHLKELTDRQTIRHLTRVNRALLDSLDLSRVEEIWFKGPDDNDLQGWVMFPPGFDPKRTYPSILEIHGGPLTQYGKFFMHEFYFLAAQGYVVYFCNPRGGRGYGEAHARSIWGAWGTTDYADVMAFADVLAAKPFIDPNRKGVMGGSYGGYLTLWIIGHTARFQAAVAQRVVSNFTSMWGSSDLNWSFELELEAGPPFRDFQKWWDLSPLKYLGNASTPTMITHSEGDLRCPIEQGEQAFVALKRAGVETEFIRFPEEFHGLSRTGRTDRRVARLGHLARWMEKYLKD
jgi:dipeptidyl aminopeptidase/acylaminoacyl peptidase